MIIGVDFASNCLDDDLKWEAEAQTGVPLVIADITNLPRVKYADYGYCCDTLTLDMPFTALEGIARTTRRGAFLAFDCATEEISRVWQRAVGRFWSQCTVSQLGNIAVLACREPCGGRIPGTDPWR